MGSIFSKNTKKNTKSDGVNLNSVYNTQQQEPYEIYDPNKYDEGTVEFLKLEFQEDPEMFILNQILMSVMFFEDFEKEIGILANTISEKGQKLNSELIKKHQKQLLVPDAILQSVNKRIKFRRRLNNELLEPLVPQRMFVLHDTVEIEDKSSLADYSRIDKPCYRAQIEEAKEHKGFVKVNLLGTIGTDLNGLKDIKRQSFDSASSGSSAKSNQKKREFSHSNGIMHGSDSGFNTESDYEYMRITAAKTPSKLQISEKDIYTSIGQLPSKCITQVQTKNKYLFDSDSEEEDGDAHLHKGNPNLFIINYYLNSSEFMLHFKNNVFPNYLGEILDFTKESIEQAISVSNSVFCETIDDFGNVVKYEIVPVIAMPWPDEIAFEWCLRERVTVLDKRQKKPIAYKWPTDKMIEEAKKLNCVVIPKGFIPKKGDNPKSQIEWEVGFPKAERYLEFRMSHVQIRIFLIIVTLYKTFIEPKTSNYGLLIEHIRNLMFWECEANYKAWPEDRMGTKLKLVLKSLYNNLSTRKLPHYFIKGNNLLENIPGKYIIPALEMLNYILESPVSHLMFALKNLKYMSGKFYPETNFDELYRIITSEMVYDQNVQIDIMAFQHAKRKDETRRRNEDSPRKQKRDKELEWDRRYLDQQRQLQIRKIISQEQITNKNLNEKPNQSEDFKVPIKKRFNGDTVRQIQLLTFFIRHFLQIAKKSFKISSTKQTLFYLKQAWYLTKLLENIDIQNAISFQSQIRDEEENCHRKQITETKIPTTPKRNATFTFPVNETVQGNFSKSNSTTLRNESKRSSVGAKINIKKSNITKQVSAEVHVQSKFPPKSSSETRKSVSFNSVPHNINLSDSDDEIEITSL